VARDVNAYRPAVGVGASLAVRRRLYVTMSSDEHSSPEAQRLGVAGVRAGSESGRRRTGRASSGGSSGAVLVDRPKSHDDGGDEERCGSAGEGMSVAAP
jgi:hypothetical protein